MFSEAIVTSQNDILPTEKLDYNSQVQSNEVCLFSVAFDLNLLFQPIARSSLLNLSPSPVNIYWTYLLVFQKERSLTFKMSGVLIPSSMHPDPKNSYTGQFERWALATKGGE